MSGHLAYRCECAVTVPPQAITVLRKICNHPDLKQLSDGAMPADEGFWERSGKMQVQAGQEHGGIVGVMACGGAGPQADVRGVEGGGPSRADLRADAHHAEHDREDGQGSECDYTCTSPLTRCAECPCPLC